MRRTNEKNTPKTYGIITRRPRRYVGIVVGPDFKGDTSGRAAYVHARYTPRRRKRK